MLDEIAGHDVDVDLVGVPGRQPERHLLAVTADEQRDVLATSCTRGVRRVGDVDMVAGEGHRSLAPATSFAKITSRCSPSTASRRRAGG